MSYATSSLKVPVASVGPIVVPPEPVLPGVPRELTAEVRRRAWFEPRVRFWWITTALFVLITAWAGVTEGSDWFADRRLVLYGQAVEATIVEAGGTTLTAQRQPWDADIKLAYTLGGKKTEVYGRLSVRRDFIIPGQTVTIRVDPAKPTLWTDLAEPRALGPALSAVWVLIPAVIGVGLMTLVERGRLLKLWRDGRPATAIVIRGATSALAPLSRSLVCALVDARDRTPFTVFVRPDSPAHNAGEVLWVIAPALGRGGRAVDAERFVR